eukprot:PhF_6_TR27888/c1_g1_i1/m.40848
MVVTLSQHAPKPSKYTKQGITRNGIVCASTALMFVRSFLPIAICFRKMKMGSFNALIARKRTLYAILWRTCARLTPITMSSRRRIRFLPRPSRHLQTLPMCPIESKRSVKRFLNPVRQSPRQMVLSSWSAGREKNPSRLIGRFNTQVKNYIKKKEKRKRKLRHRTQCTRE